MVRRILLFLASMQLLVATTLLAAWCNALARSTDITLIRTLALSGRRAHLCVFRNTVELTLTGTINREEFDAHARSVAANFRVDGFSFAGFSFGTLWPGVQASITTNGVRHTWRWTGSNRFLTIVDMPPAAAILALSIHPVLAGRRLLRQRRTCPPNICPTCHYDLRATSNRCPECGREVLSAETPSVPLG